MPALRSILLICSALVLMLVAVSACETAPPVQEMSDARQAIAVAKEAGAENLAAAELAEAERYLESAQKKLEEHEYREARSAALEAKVKALNALKMSESTKDPDGN